MLKHRSDKVEKLETTIESYKLKLEEMVDLKRQIKSLEENNTKYLEKILVMEEVSRTQNSKKKSVKKFKIKIFKLFSGGEKIKCVKISNRYVQEANPRASRTNAKRRDEE